MKETMASFVCEEDGQDLIEYTLLVAFVCFAAAALFIGGGGSIATIWGVVNNTLISADNAASAS